MMRIKRIINFAGGFSNFALVSPISALGVLIFALGIWGKRVGLLVKTPTQKSKRVGHFGRVNSTLDLRSALDFYTQLMRLTG
ncbi:MAG: hypothetical protein LBF17_01100 [Mediterranea sp.]|nr:hypothetical protein [Mediterranea sp.]